MKKSTSNIVVSILAVLSLLLIIPLSVKVYKDTHDPFKMLAREHKVYNYYIVDGELHDLIELTPSYKRVVAEVDRETKNELDASGLKGMGTCHRYWKIKKRILHDRYKIDWRPESEMNPWIIYD